jgi:hypothetical protein
MRKILRSNELGRFQTSIELYIIEDRLCDYDYY